MNSKGVITCACCLQQYNEVYDLDPPVLCLILSRCGIIRAEYINFRQRMSENILLWDK